MLNSIKNLFLTLVFIGVLGAIGYFAFTNLDSGSNYVAKQKIRDLEKENKDLSEKLADLQKRIDKYEPQIEEETVSEVQDTQVEQGFVSYKYAQLISELETLVKDNVTMKLKSRGTRVGTIQNFLNIYNNTKNKVDNDYGNSTKTAVSSFQKAVGIPATGETDVKTYNSMIDWLKKQG